MQDILKKHIENGGNTLLSFIITHGVTTLGQPKDCGPDCACNSVLSRLLGTNRAEPTFTSLASGLFIGKTNEMSTGTMEIITGHTVGNQCFAVTADWQLSATSLLPPLSEQDQVDLYALHTAALSNIEGLTVNLDHALAKLGPLVHPELLNDINKQLAIQVPNNCEDGTMVSIFNRSVVVPEGQIFVNVRLLSDLELKVYTDATIAELFDAFCQKLKANIGPESLSTELSGTWVPAEATEVTAGPSEPAPATAEKEKEEVTA
jgi:hypothetical protein